MTIFLVILGILIIIVGHELGHFLMAKVLKIKVEEFGVGLPPRLLGKKFKETLYSINLLPFGAFVRIYGEEEEKEGDKEAFLNKPFWQKSLVVLGGVLANFILAWIFFSIVFMIGAQSNLIITQVLPDSPAQKSGLKMGDVIMKLEADNLTLSSPIKIDEFIETVKNSKEKNIRLYIKRGSENLIFNIEKRDVFKENEGALGVVLGDGGIERKSFFVALGDGFKSSVGFLKMTIEGLGILLNNILKGESVRDNLAGPVGIVSFATKTAKIGYVYLLNLLALISINLIVINLIPVPALDGGRFLIYLVEKIRGKKISAQFQNSITGFSLILLLILMIFVTINDVKKFF